MKGFIEPHTAFRVRLALVLDTDSVVAQEHANDCDVTVILSRYQRTGQLPPGRGSGAFEDVSALCGADYSGVLSAVASAQEAVSSAQSAEDDALQKVKDFEASSKPSSSKPPSSEPPVPGS